MKDKIEQIELLPCPFCGGKAEYVCSNDGDYIECTRCGLGTTRHEQGRVNSVQRWNTRTESPELLRLRDALAAAEEWAGNPEISFADFVEVELTALKEALSRGWLSRGKADKPLWEKHKEQERQALIAALDERSRLDPDAPTAIVFKESSDSEQLRNTQTALRNLYKAVQKSRAVNDPLGMATAMEEAGRWF